MEKDDKTRIRVTLNLSARIYELVKRMSKVEEKAISRIVDDALDPIVKKYQFATPEDWENERRGMEEDEEAEYEEYAHQEPTEPEPDPEMERAMNNIYSASSNEARLEAIDEMRALTEKRKAQDEYRNRWIKYCSK